MTKFSTELTCTGLGCYFCQNCTLSTCCSVMSRLDKRKIKSHYLFFHTELLLLLSKSNRSGIAAVIARVSQFYLHIHRNFFYPNIMIISKRVHTILSPAGCQGSTLHCPLSEAPSWLLTVTIQSEASLPSSCHCTAPPTAFSWINNDLLFWDYNTMEI